MEGNHDIRQVGMFVIYVYAPIDKAMILNITMIKFPAAGTRNCRDHPELILFLQGVEIQRLNTLLSQHRQREKSTDKISLDRHSYEVQIQELSTLISNQDSQLEK